jgi:hypothetical protein
MMTADDLTGVQDIRMGTHIHLATPSNTAALRSAVGKAEAMGSDILHRISIRQNTHEIPQQRRLPQPGGK